MKGYPRHDSAARTAPIASAIESDDQRLTVAHELIGKEAPAVALTSLFGSERGRNKKVDVAILALKLASRFGPNDWEVVKAWLAKEAAP